eukprot:SAG11_NODE_190_length_12980_cov_11.633802_6_plen_53_part_00
METMRDLGFYPYFLCALGELFTIACMVRWLTVLTFPTPTPHCLFETICAAKP